MKKIAITGATGFLGNRTARLLSEAGFEVTALGRNVSVGRKLESDGIRFIRCELSEKSRLRDAFRGQDIVIHCAALASAWGNWSEFHTSNVVGTQNVMEAIQGSTVKRWVNISTPSIYMDGRNREGIRENEPLPPQGINYYAESKRRAERLVDEHSPVPVVTIRPQGLFGPGDPQILPRLIRIAKFGRLLRIGDGQNRIDLTYVDNVVEAIFCALKSGPESYGKKYNITNGEPVESFAAFHSLLSALGFSVRPFDLPRSRALRIAGLLEAFHRAFLPKYEPILTRYAVYILADSRTLNIDAARKDLDYKPKISLREGMKRTVDWWQRAKKKRR